MEIWLDLRQASPTANKVISSSRLGEANAIIVGDENNNDDLTVYPKAKIYTVRQQPADRRKHPPRLFAKDNQAIGAIVDVSKPQGQDMAIGLIGSVEWILIKYTQEETDQKDRVDEGDSGWIMIPAENLISSSQDTGTKLAAEVTCAGEVVGLSRALELGVDALFVDAFADEDLWEAVLEARNERQSTADAADSGVDNVLKDDAPRVIQGMCKRLSTPGGRSTVLADRVCIDLVQTLKPTEGCWLGSSAKITALVLSEAAQSSFVPSRPFRINAGPVHSYVVMGDGVTTKYLSELQAGDEVQVYDVESSAARAVAVGRLKIEIRPCIMCGLFAFDNGEELGQEEDGQVFLQQAETVRLGQRIGESGFVRVTDLDSHGSTVLSDVLLRVVESGTHVGKTYSGKVVEK